MFPKPRPAGHMTSMAPRKPPLGPERRSALGILADAPHGLTEALLMAHGVTTKLLADLVRDGLATTRRESVKMVNSPLRSTPGPRRSPMLRPVQRRSAC